ncbi:hypothetical protein COCVIDRAFT_60249, partial [Bipolaris victoriae FI3]
MSTKHADTISAALQIIFGVAGILSVVVALFSLHHRDSLIFVLCRRLRNDRVETTYEMDEETGSSNSTIVNK